MTGFKLTEEILKLSDSKIWDTAKLEWHLQSVYIDNDFDECLCGHYPIKEICVIVNGKNGNSTIVGNVCVKKFLGLSSDKIFTSVKNVQKDNEKSLNIEALTHAYDKKWITKWEYEFSVDTMRKRKLSGKQLSKRIEVNENMIRNMQKTSKN